jgi:hypothetical protein
LSELRRPGDALRPLSFNSRNVTLALNGLSNADLVRESGDQYDVLDPMLRRYVENNPRPPRIA